MSESIHLPDIPTLRVDDVRMRDSDELSLVFTDGRRYRCSPVDPQWLTVVQDTVEAENATRGKRILHAAVTTWSHPESEVADDYCGTVEAFAEAIRSVGGTCSAPLLARVFTVGRTDHMTLGRLPTNTSRYPETLGAYIAAALEKTSGVERMSAASKAAMAINEVLGPTVGASSIADAFSEIPVDDIEVVCRLHNVSSNSELPTWEDRTEAER